MNNEAKLKSNRRSCRKSFGEMTGIIKRKNNHCFRKLIPAFGVLPVILSLVFTLNIKAGQLTKDEEKLVNSVKAVLENTDADNRKDPKWKCEELVGWQFTPDSRLKSKLNNVRESRYDDDFILHYDSGKVKTSKKEFDESLYIIGSESMYPDERSFELYGKHDNSRMYVKTTDSQYVEILLPPVASNEEWPDLVMRDCDDDGEHELIILPHILYGDGYKEDTLIIVDISENGTWFAYHLSSKLYSGYLDEYFSDNTEDCPSMIDISPVGSSFYLSAGPYFDRGKSKETDEIPDDKIWLGIVYEGEGVFTVANSSSRPNAEKLYAKAVQNVSEDDYYAFVEGPTFDTPLMLVSDNVVESLTAADNEIIESGLGQLPCDVYMMAGGKARKIGTIDTPVSSSTYVSYNEEGLVLHSSHITEVYKVENKKLKLDFAVTDNVIDPYESGIEGYTTYDGKNSRTITEGIYNAYRNEYKKAAKIVFHRGSAKNQ